LPQPHRKLVEHNNARKTVCPSHTGNWYKKTVPKKPMGYHSRLNDKQSKNPPKRVSGSKTASAKKPAGAGFRD